MIKFFNGVPIPIPNIIVFDENDFYISYNKRDVNIYGSDTTAIVLTDQSKFFILDGDHGENLKGLNLAECLKYFRKNIHLKNRFSDDE